MTKRIQYKFEVVLLLLLFVTGISFSQKSNTYSGKYILGPYTGQTTYTYHVVGIDTIFDGAFKMERSNLESLLEKKDHSFLIEGQFIEGKPQGDWVFQFGEFETDSTAKVSGFQYNINVNGILEEAKGQLHNGRPEGPWIFSKTEIKDSQVADTLFLSKIAFEEGIPQQSFTIEDEQGSVLGRFLRNGLAHDTWSRYSNEGEIVENWLYDQGWLRSVEKENENRLENTIIFPNTPANFKTIDLGEGYSRLVAIYANKNLKSSFDFSEGINEVLVANTDYYKKIDEILTALGSSTFMPSFKVKAPFFPLDDSSKKQLDSTVLSIKKAKELSGGFLDNTRLNLIKRSDAQANSLYQKVAIIDSTIIQPLFPLVQLHELNILENIDTGQLSKFLFPEGLPSELGLEGVLNEDENSDGDNSNDFEAYLALATYANEALNTIAASLGQKLEDDRQEHEFVILEEQLINQANALNQFPDSIKNRLTKKQLRALDTIKSTAEEALKSYAALSPDNKKLDQARLLTNCLLHFDALSKEIAQLPEKEKQLEEKYTDAVWNPFTATIMDESVKKRLFSAYTQVLLPDILNTIENELNCANAEDLVLLMKQTYDRMLQLRDEDTSKLERKLRKERNPKTVLQLLNLKPLEK